MGFAVVLASLYIRYTSSKPRISTPKCTNKVFETLCESKETSAIIRSGKISFSIRLSEPRVLNACEPSSSISTSWTHGVEIRGLVNPVAGYFALYTPTYII
ncbi:hypothetical protein F5B21DRAFT_494543 [Xylaria acuta]|nr:hypothetical protein F5B21DRAFT_494543 [Xylaria acuta]